MPSSNGYIDDNTSMRIHTASTSFTLSCLVAFKENNEEMNSNLTNKIVEVDQAAAEDHANEKIETREF